MDENVDILCKLNCNDYKNKGAVKKLIEYILRDYVRNQDNLFGTVGVFHSDMKGIISDFKKVKKIFHKQDGVQMKHFVISFGDRPVMSRKKLVDNLKKTAGFWGERFQVVYAVHENTKHWHIHLGVNSVGYNGERINITNKEMKKFNKQVKKIWLYNAEYMKQDVDA